MFHRQRCKRYVFLNYKNTIFHYVAWFVLTYVSLERLTEFWHTVSECRCIYSIESCVLVKSILLYGRVRRAAKFFLSKSMCSIVWNGMDPPSPLQRYWFWIFNFVHSQAFSNIPVSNGSNIVDVQQAQVSWCFALDNFSIQHWHTIC